MRKFFGLFVFGLVVASVAAGQTNPTPHDLSSSAYSFSNWPASSAAGTYPPSMMFHVHDIASGTLTTPMTGNWPCAYNLTSRSRFLGDNADGFSFLNTSSGNNGTCTGTGSNYAGAAVLAVDMTGRQDLTVSWTGGLVTQGDGSPTPRRWAVRLQYRVGVSGGFTDVAGPVEYDSAGKSPGHAQTFGPVVLPSECDNQAVVQLRWIYVEVAVNSGGTRPRIRVDEINVSSSVLDVSGWSQY